MNKYVKVTIIILLIFVLAILFSGKAKAGVLPTLQLCSVSDSVSQPRIDLLHPSIRNRACRFVNRVEDELGIVLRVTDGFRTFPEQAAIYAQGRTTPGDIVTNAEPGESYHNYGLAFDVVPLTPEGGTNYNSLNWYEIGSIGEDEGFEWGESFNDKPHFQDSQGYHWSELLAMHENSEDQYLSIS